jgi:uncharacterized repeat protein (TIGR03803 family)
MFEMDFGTVSHYGRQESNMKRIWPFLFGSLLLTLPAPLQAQFSYTTNDGAITLVSDNSAGGAVVISNFVNIIGIGAFYHAVGVTSVAIPNSVLTIGGYAFADCYPLTNVTIAYGATNIGGEAFLDCTNLAAISLADSLTSIGIGAFEGCIRLTNVTIPDSVTTIETNAYSECTGLTNVAIPASVTNIEAAVFAYCPKLAAITVAEQNPSYSSTNGVFFDKSQTTLIQFPGGLSGSYTIPASVSSLAQAAFGGAGGLTSVTIPAGVTFIPEYAFNDCSALKTVTTLGSVSSIGNDAFDGCFRLTGIAIPDSVTNIGAGAFSSCADLTSIAIPDGATNIGAYAFSYCESLTSVTIPGSITLEVFEGDPITNVTIANGATSIVQNAFDEPNTVISIAIPASVTNIGEEEFVECKDLTTLTVDAGNPVYSSLNGVLFDKSQSTLIEFPDGLTGSYTIPAGVTSIGIGAFAGCANLTSVTIPGSVTNIGNFAFNDAGLTNVTIGNGVTSIGFGAFAGCTNLTRVTIPGSVTNLDDYAFAGTGLTSIEFTGNAPSPDALVFVDDSATVYYLPGMTGWGETYDDLPAVMLQVGSLQVTIVPELAVSAGARWAVDGGDTENDGATVTNLVVGNYTLSFSAVSGWLTPANQTVAVTANTTATAVGVYTQTYFTNLHSFTAVDPTFFTNSDGANPLAGLILSGNTLYGTANDGGDAGYGTVFAVNTDGSGFTNLHGFTALDPTFSTNSDGANPDAGLLLTGNMLYGTAQQGGIAGNGVVFRINTNGSGFTNLYNFTAARHPFSTNGDGAYPDATLILSANTLFGTAQQGGIAGNGTVFGINTNGSGFTNLYDFTTALPPFFTNSDGANPLAGLTSSGNVLYGTASACGSANSGTVFGINTDGSDFTNLYNFTGGSDGAYPQAGLILSGNTLYGTAQQGGAAGDGSVFRLNTDGSGFTNLYSFTNGIDGADPDAGLTLSGDVLYGTANAGGAAGNGTVFAVNTDGSGFTNLHSFTALDPTFSTNDDGAYPSAGLILSGNTLYGTTAGGGSSGNGTVFALGLPLPAPLVGIIKISLSGTSLVLSDVNAPSGGIYHLLVSADLSLPINQWTPVTTNVVGSAGNFTITATNAVNPDTPQQFYILQRQ